MFQDEIIREFDCCTTLEIPFHLMTEGDKVLIPINTLLYERVVGVHMVQPKTGEVIAERNTFRT